MNSQGLVTALNFAFLHALVHSSSAASVITVDVTVNTDNNGTDEREYQSTSERTSRICPSCECGRTNGPSDIWSPKRTDVKIANQYPWMVQMRYNDELHCAAVLITDRHVIVSISCIETAELGRVKFVIGAQQVNLKGNNDIIVRSARKIVSRKKFGDDDENRDNISIVELDEEVQIGTRSSSPRPVCLSHKFENYTDRVGLTAGWTLSEWQGPRPSTLQTISMTLFTDEKCEQIRNNRFKNLSNKWLCGVFQDDHQSICKTDGTPLTITDGKGRHQLIGILTFGKLPCGNRSAHRTPFIFDQVTNYLDWIQKNTLNACHCN